MFGLRPPTSVGRPVMAAAQAGLSAAARRALRRMGRYATPNVGLVMWGWVQFAGRHAPEGSGMTELFVPSPNPTDAALVTPGNSVTSRST